MPPLLFEPRSRAAGRIMRKARSTRALEPTAEASSKMIITSALACLAACGAAANVPVLLVLAAEKNTQIP